MKWLKMAAAGCAVATILFTAYLWFWFDLTALKSQLQQTVQQQTGRTLQIEGALGWSVYPQLGLTFDKLSLSNPAGLTPATMLQIEHGVAKVALWPLLQQQVHIQQLSVDGLVLNWISTKEGRSSLDGLTPSTNNTPLNPTAVANPTSPTAATPFPLQNLQLQQLELSNVALNLVAEGKPAQQLLLQSLTLDNWQAGQWAELSAQLQTQLGDQRLQTTAQMRLLLSADATHLKLADINISGDLAQQAFQLQAEGEWSKSLQQLQLNLSKLQFKDSIGRGDLLLNTSAAIPKLTATLQFDSLDLRPWQTPTNTSAAEPTEPTAKAAEPDLAALRTFDGKIRLSVSQLLSHSLHAADVKLNINNQRGALELELSQAKLLQGNISASVQLDSRKTTPSYQFQAKLQQLQIQPLLVALADFDKLSGLADLQVTGQGQSLQIDKLTSKLTAQGQFQLKDGAIVGANVAQLIRQFRATLQGGDNTEATALGNPQQTDFTSLTGEFTLADGLLQQTNLQLASPLLRLSGAGQVQLTERQLDYRLSTALVNSLKGQGGLAKDQLASVDIPLRIHGDLAHPKYQLDTKALYNNELKQKVDETKQDLKQKLADKLRKKFGGG